MSDEERPDFEDDYAEYDDDEYDEEEELPADPVAGALLRVALMLVIVLLVAGGSLMIFLLSMRGAPRTVIEHDIFRFEVAVDEHPENPDNWIQLSYAYAEAGRYDDAMDIIETASDAHDVATFSVVEADIYRLSGKHEAALKAYDEAEEIVSVEFDARMAELAERGIRTDGANGVLVLILQGRATVHYELDDIDAAIEDLEAAVVLSPQASDLWVLLGDFHAEAGNIEDARAAYEEALRFVPDYEQALDGLARLDEGE